MSNELTVYTTPDDLGGFAIRVIEIDGKPWFVAADVCRALGLSNPTKALLALASDEKTLTLVQGLRTGATNLISESGLYKLVMRSDKPEARKFQDWVTREVLPAIRKNGGYVMGQEKLRTGEMSRSEFMARALLMANDTINQVTAERDQFHVERDQFAARNAVLEHLRGFVTVDAYLAEENHIDGKYKSWQEKAAIGRKAAAICRERGIPIQRAPRTIRTKYGRIKPTSVGIYPREVIAEACALLGYVKRAANTQDFSMGVAA